MRSYSLYQSVSNHNKLDIYAYMYVTYKTFQYKLNIFNIINVAVCLLALSPVTSLHFSHENTIANKKNIYLNANIIHHVFESSYGNNHSLGTSRQKQRRFKYIHHMFISKSCHACLAKTVCQHHPCVKN